MPILCEVQQYVAVKLMRVKIIPNFGVSAMNLVLEIL